MSTTAMAGELSFCVDESLVPFIVFSLLVTFQLLPVALQLLLLILVPALFSIGVLPLSVIGYRLSVIGLRSNVISLTLLTLAITVLIFSEIAIDSRKKRSLPSLAY